MSSLPGAVLREECFCPSAQSAWISQRPKVNTSLRHRGQQRSAPERSEVVVIDVARIDRRLYIHDHPSDGGVPIFIFRCASRIRGSIQRRYSLLAIKEQKFVASMWFQEHRRSGTGKAFAPSLGGP